MLVSSLSKFDILKIFDLDSYSKHLFCEYVTTATHESTIKPISIIVTKVWIQTYSLAGNWLNKSPYIHTWVSRVCVCIQL